MYSTYLSIRLVRLSPSLLDLKLCNPFLFAPQWTMPNVAIYHLHQPGWLEQM